METTLPTLVALLQEQWTSFKTVIDNVDDKLGSSDGPTAIAKAAADNLGDTGEQITTAATRMFDGLSPEQTAGVAYLLRKVIKSVDPTVKAYVEANTTEVPKLSDEETLALREQRKDAVGSANAMRIAVKQAASGWATDTEDGGEVTNLDRYFPEFTNLRGGIRKGPSAPRLRGSWSWAIDGNPISGDKVKDLAKEVGVGPNELKNALKAYMESNGKEFDFGNPPARFTFEFTSGDESDPEGHTVFVISAVQRESDEDEPQDDESFDEADEDGDDLFED